MENLITGATAIQIKEWSSSIWFVGVIIALAWLGL
jgi:hypothetical protein